MRIKGQKFENDTVELDSNSFEDCEFKNCRMLFRARAPVTLDGCTFENVTWHLLDSAGLTMSFLTAMTEASGDYGRALLVRTFPGIREWLKEDALKQLEQKPEFEGGDRG